MRWWVKRGMAVALVLVVGAVVGWSLGTVLRPMEDPTTALGYTDVVVAPGTVQSSIDLNVVAKWGKVPAGVNRAAGVVTEATAAADSVARQGSIVYRVDQRPVVVAEGDVPTYRAISAGASGADVRQLQRMLAAVGFYSAAADGRAGSGMVAAIRAWQASLGLPQTGVVGVADVIFVPHLPARLTVNQSLIARGTLLVGGEPAISVLSDSPEFTLAVSSDQAALVPEGTAVDIRSPQGGTWTAVASSQSTDAKTGDVVVQLKARSAQAICGSDCALVPINGGAQLNSTVLTVAPVSGLVVPSAALQTSANGRVLVISSDGRRIPVTVKASARGLSVVDGVARGTRIRVPAVDSGAIGP